MAKIRFCKKQHAIVGDNIRKHHSGRGYVYDGCRRCHNSRQAAYYRKHPEKRHVNGSPGYKPVPQKKLKHRRPGTTKCLLGHRIVGLNVHKTSKKKDGTFYKSCRKCKLEWQRIYDLERR